MTYGLPDSAVLGTTKRLSGSVKRKARRSDMEGWDDALRLIIKNEKTANRIITGVSIFCGVFVAVTVIYLLPW
jgi:VIT1/CCC1 family predicted Fe2+/Mn2+ transporter